MTAYESLALTGLGHGEIVPIIADVEIDQVGRPALDELTEIVAAESLSYDPVAEEPPA